MNINIGDLFILLDTEVYYVYDIQYDEEMMMKKFMMFMLNPPKGHSLRKRIMYPDNIEKIFDKNSMTSQNWKYYPVSK
ncbi:MAG: hypothetical protein EBR30_24050 [Cytophagia bacterium]|jgi:hypothetical protein|nr:hypothetical protein [Cytophagia bacterium]